MARASSGKVLFAGPTVVDGSGGEPYVADLLVADGRIAAIDRSCEAVAAVVADARTIDANGLVLAPGFIDMHAHSDLAVLSDADHLAKLGQGVTTELIGQDGLGYAPVDDGAMHDIRTQIAGWNGEPPLDYSWRSMADFLARLDRGVEGAGPPTNVAVLVPQGNLRMLAVGHDDRQATPAELDRMRGILADSLDAGAVGLSSGLTYAPGMYADQAELATLCEIVADRGGFYAPHTRSYGVGALDAYSEVIDIASATGCALHLSHATLNFATNRDALPRFLELIDEALEGGVDLTLDSYPYLPGATTLAALLPSWMSVGGPDALLARLRSGDRRDAIAEAFDAGSDGFHGERADWSVIQIAGVRSPELEGIVGSSVAELADAAGEHPVDVVIDLLLRDRLGTSILMHIGHEANVRGIMRHPVHTGGSDGILVGSRPHPRGWGTFARYLAHYVRDEGVLTLAECVRHLAATPARRLGLADRGLVREGFVADLVLFDPLTVLDVATFDNPRRPAEGFGAVMIDGRVVVDDGRRTDAVAGRVLRAG
ncbi:amidohydrolase family protein [Humibacter sp. RRB41]|uniref:N-acyl-D-amino-acid deacylase family protein n=1 Tax=Humibacter sp. RRB41 TaxID=2919946 RepID=UPI001FAB2C21|nr:D-aminoacylase [Humibacter sp. RRB41]